MKQAIRSLHIITPDGIRPGVVLIDGGTIAAIESFQHPCESFKVTNADDLWVLPGTIDPHVHINEPGRTEWEGFQTATQAAAAGGCTCLVDMPLNCIPSTTNVAALEEKRRAAKGKTYVDVAYWGAVVPGNSAEIRPLADSGVRGFKCFLTHPGTDEFEMVTEADLREAMPWIAETGLPLLAHAELPQPMAEAYTDLTKRGADWRSYNTYLQSRPPLAELSAIRLLIGLCRQYHCRTHIVHLSAAEALDEIQQAKAEGLPLTVETCPHYLFFESESIPDGATQFKCAPPIRNAANRSALWQGLRDGIIDQIATDHSPCPPAMKRLELGSFLSAWGGISSLSLSLPAVWTEASQRGFSLAEVVYWLAEAPSRLAGMQHRKGRIAPGFDADLVLFDPLAEFQVCEQTLRFRHRCTPYLGRTLKGEVKTTILGGRVCFDRGKVSEAAFGREVLHSPLPLLPLGQVK